MALRASPRHQALPSWLEKLSHSTSGGKERLPKATKGLLSLLGASPDNAAGACTFCISLDGFTLTTLPCLPSSLDVSP